MLAAGGDESLIEEMALELGCDRLMGFWWQRIKCWKHFRSENKDEQKDVSGSHVGEKH